MQSLTLRVPGSTLISANSHSVEWVSLSRSDLLRVESKMAQTDGKFAKVHGRLPNIKQDFTTLNDSAALNRILTRKTRKEKGCADGGILEKNIKNKSFTLIDYKMCIVWLSQ